MKYPNLSSMRFSSVENYAGEMPRPAVKTKCDKIIEGRIGVEVERFRPTLENPSARSSKTLHRDAEQVWPLEVDALNTSCETISSLSDNI
jgi:hypothetical protein